MGGMDQYDTDCKVIVDGGPTTTNLGALTIDDVESVEIYNSSRSKAPAPGNSRRPTGIGQRKNGAATGRPMVTPDNTGRSTFENQSRFCPLVYVRLR